MITSKERIEKAKEMIEALQDYIQLETAYNKLVSDVAKESMIDAICNLYNVITDNTKSIWGEE